MGKLDLNNQLNFARATMSVGADPLIMAADLLNKLRGRGSWKISEASYGGIKFHVFKDGTDYQAGLTNVVDESGRRLAKFKFAYVDGQTTDDMGRDGNSWSFECMFHGANYLEGWTSLVEKLNTVEPQDLIHPVFGKVLAKAEKWTVTHESAAHQALTARLIFVEHNTSTFDRLVSQIVSNKPTGIKDALNKAVQGLSKIQGVIDTVQATANLATSFVLKITQDLATTQALYGQKVVDINSTFNDGGSNDIPAALNAQSGGTAGATGSVLAVAPVSFSPTDALAAGGILAQVSTTGQVLSPSQAVDSANAYRANLQAIFDYIVEQGNELVLYQQILDLQATAIALQDAVEVGIKTSRPKILDYTTKRQMTLREIAFANGLSPDRMVDIDRLNPDLDSVNMVDAGVTLQVPVGA